MGDGKSPSLEPGPSLLDPGAPDFPPPFRATGAAPFIVTAMMGAADQRFFDALRAAHYPRARHVIPAHITLFHQLPPSSGDELHHLLRMIAHDTPPPSATLAGVWPLERGVAFHIDSPDLLAVRERIADRLRGLLTVQDRGRPKLHITIQNKVSAAAARALAAEFAAAFRPRRLHITGLAAHLYRGGPWEPAFACNFRGRRR